MTPMTKRLIGAYVAAWVWVDLEDADRDLGDETVRSTAYFAWQRAGQIEIDDNAVVSYSYEDEPDDPEEPTDRGSSATAAEPA